jgi:hypothetical protein
MTLDDLFFIMLFPIKLIDEKKTATSAAVADPYTVTVVLFSAALTRSTVL